MGRPNKVNYVDKVDLHKALSEYTESGEMPERLHLMFFTMANHISRKSKYYNWHFREDMIVAAYERCVKYAKSFDLTRDNPFAYFQTTIENEFQKVNNAEWLYQNRKWKELSDLVAATENEYHITLVIPDEIKLKMYQATATIATFYVDEEEVYDDEFTEELAEDKTLDNEDEDEDGD
jgi:hypothetical protein